MRKLSYETVKNNLALKGYDLISQSYNDNRQPLQIKCSNGHIFESNYYDIINRGKKCPYCNELNGLKNIKNPTFEQVETFVNLNATGYKLKRVWIEDRGTWIEVQCEKGHNYYEASLSNFKRGKRCPICFGTPKYSYEYVKHYIEVDSNSGYKLLSEQYVNSHENLELMCDKGHIYYTNFGHFKHSNRRCSICYDENRFGETSSNWKGGITSLNEYLRNLLDDWKKESLKSTNYMCAITNEGGELKVHHQYSFNKIVKDILHELDLKVKKEIGMYSEKELQDICDSFLNYHKQNLGIPLKPKIHTLFHKTYGYGNNTPQQFEEFKERYLSGQITL